MGDIVGLVHFIFKVACQFYVPVVKFPNVFVPCFYKKVIKVELPISTTYAVV